MCTFVFSFVLKCVCTYGCLCLTNVLLYSWFDGENKNRILFKKTKLNLMLRRKIVLPQNRHNLIAHDNLNMLS